MSYYDDMSPVVLIYPPDENPKKPVRKTRYITGKFPDTITSDSLDDNLLSFWMGAYDANPMIRFIIYYRIIEYALTNYVDMKIRTQLRKLLTAPDRKANISQLVDSVTDIVRTDKLNDVAKLNGVINTTCDPKLIWREINANKDSFSKETIFDGGFKVKALIHKDDVEEQFCTHGLETFCDSIRKIRNALSHGKDQETLGVITPTTRNLQLLQPWVHLIGVAAGEVVLYKGAT